MEVLVDTHCVPVWIGMSLPWQRCTCEKCSCSSPTCVCVGHEHSYDNNPYMNSCTVFEVITTRLMYLGVCTHYSMYICTYVYNIWWYSCTYMRTVGTYVCTVEPHI